MTIKENYSYFKKHLTELMQDYYRKYIVIKDCQVIGTYNNFEDAYYETIKKEKLGTFIIQHCVSLEESTMHFANPNVSFDGIQQ